MCSLCTAESVTTITSAAQAVVFARNNSQQLFLQHQRVLENLHLRRMSFRDFLPEISFSIAENDSIAVLAPDSRTKNVQLFVTQPVFNGGRSFLDYKLGRASAEYEYKDYLVKEKQFEASVVTAYFQAILTGKKGEVKKNLLDSAKKQLLILERETELGKTLETDYLEYQIAYASVASDFRNALWEADQALQYFRVCMGLSPQTPIVIKNEEISKESIFYLQDLENYLVSRAKMVSVAIQRMRCEHSYREKIRRYDERRNLPSITLQGSVSFSGKSWPLTEPVYSLRCTIAFLNRYFPATFSSGTGWKKGTLQSVSNSGETKILSSSTVGCERKIAHLDSQSEQAEIEHTLRDLEFTVSNAVYEHDCLVDNIELQRKTLTLMDKRLKIDFLRKELGEIKVMDYLQQLIDLSAAKIGLFEKEVQLQAVRKSLEILLDLPIEIIRGDNEK
ncbi:MAG TPA: TolC family protein [Treponema sp.]|nr:TolC family protein [Treponema sp.]